LRSLAEGNVVKAVSQAGLVLAISGRVDDGDASKLFTVAETERIWPELTTMLPVGLPVITPFEHWGAALADKPGIVTLYERLAPAITS
jgi:hypothetical protein